jgi:hypothetical protein
MARRSKKSLKREETPIERVIRTKTALIKANQKEIADIRAKCEEDVARIEVRIRVNQALVGALNKDKK